MHTPKVARGQQLLLIVACFLLNSLSVIAAGQVRFKTWTTENGLPQNTIVSIAQTPDGYLWFATYDGLARFDGVRFKTFKKSNTPELPMNRLGDLFVDTAGRLWIYTEDPKTVVVYEKGRFTAFVKGIDFEADDFSEPFRSRKEMRFQFGHDDYVFNEGRFERRPTEQINYLPKVSHNNSGLTWIDVGNAYYGVNEKQSTIYPKDRPLPFDSRKLIGAYFLETDGALWFFMYVGGQIRLVRFRDGQFKVSSISVQWALPIQKDLSGNLWISNYYHGLTRIDAASLRDDDPANLKFEHFSTESGLSNDFIRVTFTDRDGNIWVGTEKGLNLINDDPTVKLYSKATGLPDENIYAIAEDKAGAIWFGAWDNYLIRHSNGTFTSEHVKWVESLFIDRDSRLWVSANLGLLHRDNDKVQWDNFFTRVKTPGIKVISQDREGNMWFGGSGIARYQNGQFRKFDMAGGLPYSVTSFLQTSSGDIWVGTVTGLARFDGERFVPFPVDNKHSGIFVRSLYEDREGTLWIGSYDSGLTRYKNGKFATINSADGLFSDGVFCILEDDDGWFWMNSNQGIYRVRRDDLNELADGQIASVSSVSYGPDDGLINVEGNGGKQPAGLKASDGRLWFPTAGGVAVIDPRRTRRNHGPPPVLIEDISVDQKAMKPGSSVLRVEPGQSAVDISYTALSFFGGERVKFRYRLEGLDQNWTEAGARRIANFSHIPFGEYTFRVIAVNQDGVWNTAGATLTIVVVAPFYRTYWFYALAVLLLLATVSGGYFYRVRQLQAQNDARAEFTHRLIDSQESERRRIALELHDSLGQSLAVIRNRALLSLNKADDHERMHEQMREISEASKAALRETREIAHNLHPGQIEHLGLPAALATLVESVAIGTSIEFEAKIDKRIVAVSRDEAITIYRIAQESLSNLIKHSNASHAIIALHDTTERLNLSIEDNGRGIPSGNSDGGLGLKGIRERAQIINAELQIESSAGKGTRITVSLPRSVVT